MDEDFYGWLLLATAALALMLLWVGAFVRAAPRRGLSDWVMIGGMGVSFLAIVVMIVMIVALSSYTYYSSPNYDLWMKVMMAVGFAIPGGVVVFSGGFLLSRFEARRQAAQLELFTQGMQPQPGAMLPSGPRE